MVWGARVVRVAPPKSLERTVRERWRTTCMLWGIVLGLAMGGAAAGLYEVFVRDELETELVLMGADA